MTCGSCLQQTEHKNEQLVTGQTSIPRTANASGAKCGPPCRRAYPARVEQDQETEHGWRNHRVAQSRPRPRRSAVSNERNCDLVAERRRQGTEFVLAGESASQVKPFHIFQSSSSSAQGMRIETDGLLGCSSFVRHSLPPFLRFSVIGKLARYVKLMPVQLPFSRGVLREHESQRAGAALH